MKVESIEHKLLKIIKKKASLFVLIGMIINFVLPIYGSRAVKQIIPFQQPDSTLVYIQIQGDEFFHYTTTTDGYVIIENDSSAYVYAQFNYDRLVPTSILAHNPQERNNTESDFLKKQVKGLPETFLYAKEQQGMLMKSLQEKQQMNYPGCPSTGNYKIPVLLIEFADKVFQPNSTKELFERKFNEIDYNYNNATGSVQDYFRENSQEKLQIHFDVYGPIKVSYKEGYYAANNEQQAYEMVQEACEIAIQDHGLILSDYDINKDGIIENISVIYAGADQAQGGGRNTIWAHCSYNPIMVNNTLITSLMYTSELYATSKEIDGIGTFCHEFGHLLGLPDLYNTLAATTVVDHYALMDCGNFNNYHNTPPYLTAIERYLLGWLEPTIIPQESTNLILPPIRTNQAYRINTDQEGEFFLLENRSPEGWDKSKDLERLGYGMLIYHIDRSGAKQPLWSIDFIKHENANMVNTNPKHYCCYLKQATKEFIAFHQDSQNHFTGGSATAATSWNGISITTPLTEITYDNNLVSFSVCQEVDLPLEEAPLEHHICVFNESGLFIDGLNDQPCQINIYNPDGVLIRQWKGSDSAIQLSINKDQKTIIVQVVTEKGSYEYKRIRTK